MRQDTNGLAECLAHIKTNDIKLLPPFICFPGGSDGKESAWMWETQIPSLGCENPLEKGMATYSSILAWKIAWTEEPGGVQSMGSQRVGHDWSDQASMHACNLDKISGSNHTLPSQLSSSLGWVFFWCINWMDFVFLLDVFLCHGEDRYTRVWGLVSHFITTLAFF